MIVQVILFYKSSKYTLHRVIFNSSKSAGVYANAETVYGIKWYPQSGTINGTKISVYGVK